MKKAYLIIAHKKPEQLHRLISRLNDGQSKFFIHIDKTVNISQFRNLYDFGELVHFLDRLDSKWGGFNMVQATINGLKGIKNTSENFERVILISGQDYPIKSNEYINNFLLNSPHSVFIDFFPIPNYRKWPGRDRGGWYRVDKYYFGLKWYELLCSKSLNLLSTYIPLIKRKIPGGMKPFTGSQWWILDMYALNYILEFEATNPHYKTFHKSTFAPDELFFQMIIANSSDERLAKSIENNNKRLMVWETPGSAHPNTLRKGDLETILASDHLFARKFDDKIDNEILDLIDTNLLNRKIYEQPFGKASVPNN